MLKYCGIFSRLGPEYSEIWSYSFDCREEAGIGLGRLVCLDQNAPER